MLAPSNAPDPWTGGPDAFDGTVGGTAPARARRPRRRHEPPGPQAEGTFHVFRHTAASRVVAAGVPLFDVAEILGPSTLAVTTRYAHSAPEASHAAMDRLGDALAVTSNQWAAEA